MREHVLLSTDIIRIIPAALVYVLQAHAMPSRFSLCSSFDVRGRVVNVFHKVLYESEEVKIARTRLGELHGNARAKEGEAEQERETGERERAVIRVLPPCLITSKSSHMWPIIQLRYSYNIVTLDTQVSCLGTAHYMFSRFFVDPFPHQQTSRPPNSVFIDFFFFFYTIDVEHYNKLLIY